MRTPCHRKIHRFGILPAIVALLDVGAISCKARQEKNSPFGGQLPPSAQNVQEAHIDTIPDWEYYLQATMPPQDCEALLAKVAKEQDLRPITEHQWVDGKGDWGPANIPAWWQPTWAEGHHHGRSNDINTCAMCKGSTFFYWSGSH